MYQIEYDVQPQKFFEKTDAHIARRIIDKFEDIFSNNPVPQNSKSVIGEHGVFRVRIGDYRALFRINHPEKKIIIFKIDKRESVYD